MSQFIETAMQIIEAAEGAVMTGHALSDYSILCGTEGIRLVADSDWPLDSLQREHGARAAYRVQSSGGRIRVDGRAGERTCHLEATPAVETARFLLNSRIGWDGRSAGAGRNFI